MDLNEGAWEGIKYLWQIVAGILSAALSYVFYRYKKEESRIDKLETSHSDSHTLLRVFEVRLDNIVQDIEEIKQDLKKVLFKL